MYFPFHIKHPMVINGGWVRANPQKIISPFLVFLNTINAFSNLSLPNSNVLVTRPKFPNDYEDNSNFYALYFSPFQSDVLIFSQLFAFFRLQPLVYWPSYKFSFSCSRWLSSLLDSLVDLLFKTARFLILFIFPRQIPV